MKILVTGGAGFIGSVAVKKLLEKGYDVVVIDNLSKGIRKLVDQDAVFYEEDLINRKEILAIFEKEKPDVVMHFAAYKAVGESMTDPIKYSANITGLINLLEGMQTTNCKRIIYSSSTAVYGEPIYSPMDELHPLKPINYYGYTKLVGEQILQWYAQIYGLRFVALRYFNVVGDGGLHYIDPSPEQILPIIMDVIIGKRDKITIFGDDYDTRDGTCIRDYIDVNDLIDAHISALDLNQNECINLGTSRGVSVKEFINVAKEVSKKNFAVDIGPQRLGDPKTLTGSNKKAKELLNWEPKKEFRETMKDTYNVYMLQLDEKKDD